MLTLCVTLGKSLLCSALTSLPKIGCSLLGTLLLTQPVIHILRYLSCWVILNIELMGHSVQEALRKFWSVWLEKGHLDMCQN